MGIFFKPKWTSHNNMLLRFWFFWDKVLCHLGWSQTPYVAKEDFRLLTDSPSPSSPGLQAHMGHHTLFHKQFLI